MARALWLGHRATRDVEGAWHRGDRVTLDPDALVRHAFVCGASGFGKTVFCKGLVEEAVLAGIPVIAVDFKGDLASLALTGELAGPAALGEVFGDEAVGIGAEFVSGAERHGTDPVRAAAYADIVFPRLFTPNSSLGQRLALSALPSFPDAPRTALEREERDELIQALLGGFALQMFGTPSAVKKNEPALKLVEELVRWCADRGEALEGAAGISRVLELVAEPPFQAMGGMSIEDYLPERDKKRLMQKLNSRLLGAERLRYEGRRLTVETLIERVPAGKVPLSVVYLGHVPDFTEQSSVLGQLCADIYRWMRKTGGSSGTRLLVYVDELGGGDAKQAFYPSAPHNPPSKAPLNLLVRQARSAGVAMVLATQNPMSVDVRGLGNINTWAIGRLTRKNDHARVEDLLARMPEGAQDGAVAISQLPAGVVLAASDGLPDGPMFVKERWLYSVHRQLSPSAVAAISAQLAERDRALGLDAPPTPVAEAPDEDEDDDDLHDRHDDETEDADDQDDDEDEDDDDLHDRHDDDDQDDDEDDDAVQPPPRAVPPPPAVAPRRDAHPTVMGAAVRPEADDPDLQWDLEDPRAPAPQPRPKARTRRKPEVDAPTLIDRPLERDAGPSPRDRRRQRQARAEAPPPPPAPAPTPAPAAARDDLRETMRASTRPTTGRRPRAAPPAQPPEVTDELLAESGTQWYATPQPAPAAQPPSPKARRPRAPARQDTDDTDALLLTGTYPHEPADDGADDDEDLGPTHRFPDGPIDPDGPTEAMRTEAAAALIGPGDVTPRQDRPVNVRFARAPQRLGDVPTERTEVQPTPAAPRPALRPTAAQVPLSQRPTILHGEADDDDREAHERETVTLRTSAVWVVRAGPRSWTVPSGAPLRIGRSSRAEAQLDDPHVSRIQVELSVDGTTLVVRPVGAKNPTLVDGRTVVGPLRLEPGGPRTLRVGQTDLELRCERPR